MERSRGISKIGIAVASIFMALALTLAFAPTDAFASSNPTVTRLKGSDRYGTAAAISSEAFPYSGTVIIATGQNFPDALSASALAGIANCPVLLTSKDSLPSRIKTELEFLDPGFAIIIGGTSVVSDNVKSELEDIVGKGNVDRVYGSSRYATSDKIYEYGANRWGKTAIVATGEGFADALSVSSFAYANKYPIFLASLKNGLTSDAKKALSNFDQVIIVGGTGVVSAKTQAELEKIVPGSNVIRIKGANRYATSLAVAQYAIEEGMTAENACIATGKNFPDALAGGVLAGKNESVMLLADEGAKDGYVALNALCMPAVMDAYALGGNGVLPDTVIYKALDMMKDNSLTSKVKNAKVGDRITFGTYPYYANGKTAEIEWEVVAKTGNKALVVSVMALDGGKKVQYNANSSKGNDWESSDLYYWLNHGFKRIAGLNAIEEEITILSLNEATTYYADDSSRICFPTGYALSQYVQRIDQNPSHGCQWWLRTPGKSGEARFVFEDGQIQSIGIDVTKDYVGVRPAIWVKY